MAARDNPRGFVEYKHLSGAVCPATRRYRVKADGLSGQGIKLAGQPVTLVSGNTVAIMSSPASAGRTPVVGVIRHVLNSDGRPFTHNLPSNPPQIPASTAGFVEVNIDPHQTYLVSTDATVVSTLIGQFVDATVAAAGTAAGRSGFIVEVATGTNTAGATTPFQVVDIADNNLDGIVGGEGNQDVEVKIANHVFNQTYFDTALGRAR